MSFSVRRRSICMLTCSALLCGCGSDERPRPLTPVFTSPPRAEPDVPADPLSPADQPGSLYEPEARGRMDRRPPTESGVPQLSKTVKENVRVPGARAEEAIAQASAGAPAATAPTTTPGISSGQYLTLGGVVMEVNGTPIYANEVMRIVEPILARRAKDLTERQFRDFAERQIAAVVDELRDFQLGYAAAERELDQKDKDLADALTMQWRQREINAAGGSEEIARRQFAERGQDFDERVQQQYRYCMLLVYKEKRLMPRVQVSANEIRQYYDQNLEREFTQPESARFRLIKIEPGKLGGDREEARRLIAELRNRIVKAGESFEAIARSVNHEPRWLASGGNLGAAIQRGAFAIEPVEQAVWETPQGQVTPVIETPGAFYLALVEEKTPRKTLSFDDEAVQTQIADRLRAREFNLLDQQIKQNLINKALVRTDREMMNIAVEMAMQNYPRWAER